MGPPPFSLLPLPSSLLPMFRLTVETPSLTNGCPDHSRLKLSGLDKLSQLLGVGPGQGGGQQQFVGEGPSCKSPLPSVSARLNLFNSKLPDDTF